MYKKHTFYSLKSALYSTQRTLLFIKPLFSKKLNKKMSKKIIYLLLFLITFSIAKADEGMWMLPLIEKLNIQKMENLGIKMTADEIYSNENVSLKDAIIVFGNGCTGVMVSQLGLLFTNHHCGYSAIQKLSSVEHNYLKDGFTAKEQKDELQCEGLTVKFLVKVEDVTDRIFEKISGLSGKERTDSLNAISIVIEKEGKAKDTHISQVRSFYENNEYYLFVYEEFKDVRLAYTPPSSIGKFGGETDNWMYPRHTGDFSVFRVYSDSDGNPATFSEENTPYSPKRFAAISNQGFEEGDFAMILGNPGTTDRYATSFAIKNRVKNGNGARIEMRGVKQDVWKKYMRADEAINIAYANKYAGSSNYWKNSIGMNNAIKRLNIIKEKENEEKAFLEWIKLDNERIKKYGNVLESLEKNYILIDRNQHAIDYLRESLLMGVELPSIAIRLSNKNFTKNLTSENLKEIDGIYKDYVAEVDKNAMIALLEAYKSSVDSNLLPSIYQSIFKKHKNNNGKFVEDLFKKSVFTSKEKLIEAIKKGKTDFSKDPALLFYNSIQKEMEELRSSEYTKALDEIKNDKQLYVAGLKEWAKEKNEPLYPDANFTMRLTYGQILGYKPFDGANYNFFTTTDGVLEKEDAQNPEFNVPTKLKSAITNKDFGNFTDKKDEKMHVAFISNNDITGGNSGSPVFNAKGEVIGLAFDGNWEAMSGDIIFESNLQRCINVDIRYVLFVMEKIGNAERLINELTIK